MCYGSAALEFVLTKVTVAIGQTDIRPGNAFERWVSIGLALVALGAWIQFLHATLWRYLLLAASSAESHSIPTLPASAGPGPVRGSNDVALQVVNLWKTPAKAVRSDVDCDSINFPRGRAGSALQIRGNNETALGLEAKLSVDTATAV
jgi:hypothetical protein